MKLLAALFAFALIPCLWAQTSTGSLNGYVLDKSSAAIAAAKITLRETATGETRTAATDERGQFVFPALLPGTYELTAEAKGFKRAVRDNVVVEVQQVVRIDPVLEVGNVTETVEVRAEIPLLQASTSSLGQIIDNQKILDLPLEGRNTIELMALTTGVVPLNNFGGLPALGNAYGQGNVSVGGSGGMSSSVLLDGSPSNGFLVNAPVFVPSVDTVGEFKVQTNAFSAEFGRASGGVINVAMKSGTNTLHGVVFEFLRNSALDANSFFNNRVGAAKAPLRYNLFGGTIGGPVWVPKVYNGKDRTFFFVAYEGFRQKQGITPIDSVPTVLQRAGNFSQTVTGAGQRVTVYDPLTVYTTTPGNYARLPFPNNIVPQNRFDPVAAKVMQYYPVPNLAGNPLNQTQNFIGSAVATNQNDQINIKIDESPGTRHRLFARYSRNNTLRGAGEVFGDGNPFSGVNPTGGDSPITIRGQQLVVRDTIVAGPTLLMELSIGVTRQFINKVPWSFGAPLTNLGFPAALSSAMPEYYYPNFSFTNFNVLQGSSSDLIRRGDDTGTAQGSVTKIAGSSTLKVGGEYRLLRANDYQPPIASQFAFSSTWTQQNPRNSATGSGYDLASFLLGYAASGSQSSGPAMAIQSHYFGGYAQDDWHVTRRLTFNLGLRYDLETPRTERYNRMNWFNFTAPSPLASVTGIPGLHGGLVFAGVDGNGRRQMVMDPNNFAPRAGFAFALNSRTTVRGGYGIFYSPLAGTTLGTDLGYGGYSVSTAMLTTNDSGLTAAAVLSNPYPTGINQAVGNSQGLATLIGQNLDAVDHGNHAGYVQQYNFDIQRLLPGGFLVDAAYAGSHALHIGGFQNFNQLNPADYSLRSALLVNVKNPFYGLVPSGTLASTTTTTAQLLLSYPQFLTGTTSGVSVLENQGNSNYNSLQLKLERRMAWGFAVMVSYTAAKSIGDGNPNTNFESDLTGAYQDNWNRRLERSLLPWDVSQRAVITYSYILPLGRGKRFGAKWNRALDALAGGWQVNGITTAQTGTPLGMTLSSANTYGGTRPNSTGHTANLPAGQRTVNRWFDVTAFTEPPSYSLGDTSRTLPDVRGPGLTNFDCSLFKTVSVTEKWKVQIRGEAFNLLNHTNLGTPNTSFGSASFGSITTSRASRTMQLALKVNF